MLLRERIIVLKAFPFRESDLIVKGLNSRGFQMSFMAVSALKSRKRFAGGILEPASFIEVEYRPSKKSLHRLRQAWLLRDFRDLRESYDRLQTAFYILKIATAVSVESGTEDSSELFSLVGNALFLAQSSLSLDKLKLFFQIKLLFLQGVLPRSLAQKDILSGTLRDHQDFKMDGEEEKEIFEKTDQALNRYLHL